MPETAGTAHAGRSAARSSVWSRLRSSQENDIMRRASKLFLALVGVALGACDVKVNTPPGQVVVEKKTTVVHEYEKPPVKIDVEVKK